MNFCHSYVSAAIITFIDSLPVNSVLRVKPHSIVEEEFEFPYLNPARDIVTYKTPTYPDYTQQIKLIELYA